MGRTAAPRDPSVLGGADDGEAFLTDVFVSHVEEDSDAALALADGLQEAGYSTWCYERDSVPGPSYLLQTSNAIEASRAVVVLISPHSLGSHQVTSEVVRAHETVKPFIPVLIDVSHVEFGARQPEWREAIGSATTITMPRGGVPEILPRVVEGLKALGIEPAEGAVRRPATAYAPGAAPGARPPRPSGPRRSARRLSARMLVALALVAALIVGGVVALVATHGGGEKGGGQPTPTPTGTSTSQTSPEPSSTGSITVKDAATTPLQTTQGNARVRTARLESRVCPPAGVPGECITAPAGNRILVLDIYAWGSGDIVYNQGLSMEGFASYVSFEGQRATPSSTSLLEGNPSGFRVVYSAVPAAAAGDSVILFWGDNPPLRVRVA
jgi:hypothetical protein